MTQTLVILRQWFSAILDFGLIQEWNVHIINFLVWKNTFKTFEGKYSMDIDSKWNIVKSLQRRLQSNQSERGKEQLCKGTRTFHTGKGLLPKTGSRMPNQKRLQRVTQTEGSILAETQISGNVK